MTILDEKEPTISLKVVVVVVSLVTVAAFASLFALNSAQTAAHHLAPAQSASETGNI